MAGAIKDRGQYSAAFWVMPADDGKHWRQARGWEIGTGKPAKRLRIQTHFKFNKEGKREADLAFARYHALLVQDKLPMDSREQPLLVGEWIAKYLQTPEFKEIKGNNKRECVFRTCIIPFLGAKALTELTDRDIDRLREHVAARPNRLGRPMALATVNLWQQYLSSCLNTAMDRKYASVTGLTRNVCHLVTCPDPKNKRARLLTQAEWIKLQLGVPEWFFPVMVIAYFLGMRESEILKLTWDRVDLSTTPGRIKMKIYETKNDEERMVPLHPDLQPLFEQLAERPDRHPSGCVLLKENRYGAMAPINLSTFNAQWRRSRKALGFGMRDEKGGLTFHDLRHCAATNLRRAGVDWPTLKMLMGWKTNESAMRYMHMVDEDMAEVATSVGQFTTRAGLQLRRHISDTATLHDAVTARNDSDVGSRV